MSKHNVTPAECVLITDKAAGKDKERSVCLQMLMLKGVSVSFTTPDGNTLLHLAALNLHIDICMDLVAKGVWDQTEGRTETWLTQSVH